MVGDVRSFFRVVVGCRWVGRVGGGRFFVFLVFFRFEV